MLSVPISSQKIGEEERRFCFTREFQDFYRRRPSEFKRKTWGDYIHRVNFQRIRSFLPQKARILAIGPRVALFASPQLNLEGCGIDPYLDSKNLAGRPGFQLFHRLEDLDRIHDRFDYIVLSFSIGMVEDILESLLSLRRFCHPRTRFIITYYNRIWQPAIKLAEALGLKPKTPAMNWVPIEKIEHFMNLADIQIIQHNAFCLMPLNIPFLSNAINKFIANLPFLDLLGVLSVVLGRIVNLKEPEAASEIKEPKVSVIVPARNEAGNIREVVKRIPQFPGGTEIIFVEGGSSDGTRETIQQTIDENPRLDILFLTQEGKGKKDAVKKGFDAATGDILAIVDADITVPPESLTLFIDCILNGKGEFINGSRMVYPMRGKAMRFLNAVGNLFFSACFSYLLGQKVDDTLCGTKVLTRNDYLNILKNSDYFGDWDPYGDFDLLFGATHLNLKIVDLPVRYNERSYGTTSIRRWRDGLFLLKMVIIGVFKLKFHWLSLREKSS